MGTLLLTICFAAKDTRAGGGSGGGGGGGATAAPRLRDIKNQKSPEWWQLKMVSTMATNKMYIKQRDYTRPKIGERTPDFRFLSSLSASLQQSQKKVHTLLHSYITSTRLSRMSNISKNSNSGLTIEEDRVREQKPQNFSGKAQHLQLLVAFFPGAHGSARQVFGCMEMTGT